jgi:transposase
LILDAVAAKSDITLVELRGKLIEHGVAAGVASLWCFFKRRKITLKKRRRTPPSNDAAI